MSKSKKKEYRCKYCGTNAVPKYSNICASCTIRLRLIRKMQKMIRDTVELKRKERENA